MRRKDRYIGRLYSEFGKVSSDSGIFRSTGELREFTGEYMGLIRPYGNSGERPKGRRPAPPFGPNWTRGSAPLSLFLSPSFPFSYSNKGGGILLGLGSPSRTPHLARPLLGPASSPPCSFIYGGRGHPIDTQVDLRDRSLAVCGAPLHHIPPRSYCRGA